MSVTFSHTAEPIIGGWYNECGCGAWRRSEEFQSYEAAAEMSGRNGCSDEFCGADRAFVTPCYVGVEPVTANFSNANARHVLSLLGIRDEELCGSMSVDEFERALALAEPTDGIPDYTTMNVGGERITVEGHIDVSVGRFVECGRDVEYDVRTLESLREIVAQARELRAEQICWA